MQKKYNLKAMLLEEKGLRNRPLGKLRNLDSIFISENVSTGRVSRSIESP